MRCSTRAWIRTSFLPTRRVGHTMLARALQRIPCRHGGMAPRPAPHVPPLGPGSGTRLPRQGNRLILMVLSPLEHCRYSAAHNSTSLWGSIPHGGPRQRLYRRAFSDLRAAAHCTDEAAAATFERVPRPMPSASPKPPLTMPGLWRLLPTAASAARPSRVPRERRPRRARPTPAAPRGRRPCPDRYNGRKNAACPLHSL